MKLCLIIERSNKVTQENNPIIYQLIKVIIPKLVVRFKEELLSNLKQARIPIYKKLKEVGRK